MQIHDLKENLKETNDKLKVSKIKSYLEPVILSLAALSSQTQLNFDDILKMIDLLEKILANLKNEQVMEKIRHEKLQADLDTLINNLNDWIAQS